jgi:hypothetical protein
MTQPEPLERVRRFAMPEGPASCRGFQLSQEGEIRFAPEKPWIPFRAEQWFGATGLEFRWIARTRLARVLPVVVLDAFEGGHGRLAVRLAGIVPVAHAEGPVADRAEMMRSLAELPWRPTAFAADGPPGVSWSEPAPGVLRAGFDDGVTRCHVDLEVDSDGRVLAAGAPDRPRAVGKTFVSTPWRGAFADYRVFGRFRVPTRAEVSWLLPEGGFSYFRCRVTSFRAVD